MRLVSHLEFDGLAGEAEEQLKKVLEQVIPVSDQIAAAVFSFSIERTYCPLCERLDGNEIHPAGHCEQRNVRELAERPQSERLVDWARHLRERSDDERRVEADHPKPFVGEGTGALVGVH